MLWLSDYFEIYVMQCNVKGWGPTVQSFKLQSIFKNMVQLVLFMKLLYPRLEEERQVLSVCLSVRPSLFP